MPAPDPVLELVQREELAGVATDPEPLEALELEVDEAHQRQAERDVDVARRRAQLLDPADRRDEPAPVAEQDEQEERDEQRDVRLGGRSGDAEPEVAQELVEPFEDVLGATRDELRAAAIRIETMSTTAMTIHIVRMVELMLG